MPEQLAESINELIPVFRDLHATIETDLVQREQDRKNNRRAGVALLVGLFIVVIALGTEIAITVYFHATTQSVNKRDAIIADCVNPPKKPSLPGTPLLKLSCYERGQQQTANAVKQLLVGQQNLDQQILLDQRNLDQQILDQLKPGNTYQLPYPSLGGSSAPKS